MPQIFNVVRCFSCSTFQVHQVKKAKKWACKVCGEKQSLIKVYGQGTGAECRQHVQRLNYLRQDMDEKEYQMAMENEFLEVSEETDNSSSSNNCFTSGANGFQKLSSSSQSNNNNSSSINNSINSSSSSKWSKFLPCENESNHLEDDSEEEEEEFNRKDKKQTNSQTFLSQEKRKNPFSRESPKITSYFMKKPRTAIKNNIQLSSINSEKSPNWSHSVSVESRNRGTNLITRHQPVNFENLDEVTSDEPCETLQNGRDVVKTRKEVSNSFSFYSSFPMARSQSCLSGVCGEGVNFPARDLTANLSTIESRRSEGEEREANGFLKSGSFRSLDYEKGLKDPQDGCANDVMSVETLPRLNDKNFDNSISSSGVDKQNSDGDAGILSLPCKSSSNERNNITDRNFPFSKNLEPGRSEINSPGSNYLSNIFQIEENEVDFDF